MQLREEGVEMRAVKDIISSMENEIKNRSRRGYQALTRSFAELRESIGDRTGRVVRRFPRSKGGGPR